MKPTLLVLAAGMGSRYGGLKQIDAVGPNGEAILDYSVYDAIRAGFGKVVFIIRRDIEDVFKNAVGNKFQQYVPVEYTFQELDNIPEGFSVPPERKKPWEPAMPSWLRKMLSMNPLLRLMRMIFMENQPLNCSMIF